MYDIINLMSTSKKVLGVLLLFIFVLILNLFPGHPRASVGSCEATVDPSSIAPNSSGNLNFAINNSGTASIIWVKITPPSANFTVTGGSNSGWSASVSGSSVTFTGGSQAVGTSSSYQVSVTTAGETSPASWTVQVSDDGGGAGATNCSSATVVTIGSSPVITSGVTVTVVDTSTVTLTWTTDEVATSTTEYGLTDEYADSVSETSATTNHSVTLSSLLANTTYHFSITNTDALGNSSSTADSTFTTSLGTSTTVTTTTTTTTTKKTDTQSPKISLKTNFEKPFKEVPLISGTATDDISVDKIEYSVDGGRNYSSVKITKGTSVNFSFRPSKLEDGNYDLVVRATDSSNKSDSATSILIIDTLPPAVGGNNIFLGPQNIFPGADGTITSVVGSEATIAVNSVGGPIKIEFKVGERLFAFSQIEGTNIWKGKLKFENEGEYALSAVSEDGAGNVTERKINSVKVLSSGRVTNLQGGTLQNAMVTLYVFSEALNSWSIWDAGIFGQENPQAVKDGQYGFLIPAGEYYLVASAEGYRTTTSRVFTVDGTSVLNSNITLTPRPSITIFGKIFTLPPFLDFGETFGDFEVTFKESEAITDTSLVGTRVPDLAIKTSDGGQIKLSDLGGKKVFTFLLLTTWSPASQEQLSVLDRLEERGFSSLPIFMMESEPTVKSFLRRGGYKITAGIDPEGALLKNFPITSLPQHFFLDEAGVIREVVVGTKSQKQLREILESID